MTPIRLNPKDPKDKTQREYTHENATKPYEEDNSGGYRGGHDTITAEVEKACAVSRTYHAVLKMP